MKKTILSMILVAPLILINLAGTKGGKENAVKVPRGFVYIPLGSAKIDGKIQTIPSFYMSETEVTNAQYQVFLDDLIKQGRTKEYESAKPDNSLWSRFDVSGTSEYANDYCHKQDFPVVNISREGAALYCKWLSSKFPENKTEFRLPTGVEWEYAARGGYSESPYPWGGQCLKKSMGYLAQFKVLGSIYGPVAVKNFKPNDFGLYDMTGNVSEMLSDSTIVRGGNWNDTGDKIQISNCEKYTVSPMVGIRPIISYISDK
jgi:formylglycine-generating enzyme required for sulfatase activity